MDKRYYGRGNQGIERSHPEEDQRNLSENCLNEAESDPSKKYPDAKEKIREIRKMLESK